MQVKKIQNGLIFRAIDAISSARSQKMRVSDQKRMRKALRILGEEAQEIQEIRDEKKKEFEGAKLEQELRELASGTTEVQLPEVSTATFDDLMLDGTDLDILEVLFGKELEDQFPKAEALREFGLRTYESVRDYFGDLTDIDTIGESSAKDIRSRVNQFENAQAQAQQALQAR